MKNVQIKKIIWCIIVISIFILQFFCREQFGDDIVFSSFLDEMSLGAFINKRYTTWSSRIVIEFFLVFIASWSPLIWQILNGMIIVLFIEAVSSAFGVGEKYNSKILLSCIMVTIPVASLNSAGWITTTMNYLWVLALGMIVIASLKKIIQGRLTLFGFSVSIIALIYAANMEQMAAILLGTYLVVGIYMAVSKKPINWMYFVHLTLIVLSICFILFSPGNARRTVLEAEKYFPLFGELTVFQKVCMGFLVTTRYYIADEAGRWLFILLCITLLAGVIIRNKKHWLKWIIAGFPLLSIMLLELLKVLLRAGLWNRGLRVLEVIWNNNSIGAFSIFKEEYIWIQMLYYLIVIICVLLNIYWIHGHSVETLLELTIIMAGLMSRFIIGFSPTIYVSGDRTALFASAAFLIITMRNIQQLRCPQ